MQLVLQLFFFKLAKNQKFDIAIMFVILLNMLTMGMEFYRQDIDFPVYSLVLDYVNTVFIVIFTCECVIKMLALRQYYFKEPWNIFDFVVVVISVLSTSRIGAK